MTDPENLKKYQRVAEANASGQTKASLAREYEVSPTTITHWLRVVERNKRHEEWLKDNPPREAWDAGLSKNAVSFIKSVAGWRAIPRRKQHYSDWELSSLKTIMKESFSHEMRLLKRNIKRADGRRFNCERQSYTRQEVSYLVYNEIADWIGIARLEPPVFMPTEREIATAKKLLEDCGYTIIQAE